VAGYMPRPTVAKMVVPIALCRPAVRGTAANPASHVAKPPALRLLLCAIFALYRDGYRLFISALIHLASARPSIRAGAFVLGMAVGTAPWSERV